MSRHTKSQGKPGGPLSTQLSNLFYMTYITIKEATNLTGKNEKTIRRLLKKHISEGHYKMDDGKILIDTEFIYSIFKLGQMSTQVGQISTQAEIPTSTAQQAEESLNKEYYLNLLAAKETTIGILSEQVRAKDSQLQMKDEQIGQKDSQINQLTERNRESNIIIQSLQEKVSLKLKPAETPQQAQPLKPNPTDQLLIGVAIVSAVALLAFIGLMIYAYLSK